MIAQGIRLEEVDLGLEDEDEGQEVELLHGRPSPSSPPSKVHLRATHGELQELRARFETSAAPQALLRMEARCQAKQEVNLIIGSADWFN